MIRGMSYERWLWTLEGAARYFELLDMLFRKRDEKATKILMEVCDDCKCSDVAWLAQIYRDEKVRLETYAAAAQEHGSVGINIHVMLPPEMMGRFDEAEGTTQPDPGTTHWLETRPRSDNPVGRQTDEDDGPAGAGEQGHARAREEGPGEDRGDPGHAPGGGGQLPTDSNPKNPGDQTGGGR